MPFTSQRDPLIKGVSAPAKIFVLDQTGLELDHTAFTGNPAFTLEGKTGVSFKMAGEKKTFYDDDLAEISIPTIPVFQFELKILEMYSANVLAIVTGQDLSAVTADLATREVSLDRQVPEVFWAVYFKSTIIDNAGVPKTHGFLCQHAKFMAEEASIFKPDADGIAVTLSAYRNPIGPACKYVEIL